MTGNFYFGTLGIVPGRSLIHYLSLKQLMAYKREILFF